MFHRFVYKVFDPDFPMVLRYVGEAFDVEERSVQHLRGDESFAGARGAWFMWCSFHDKNPRFEVVEHVSSRFRDKVRILARDAERRCLRECGPHSPAILNRDWRTRWMTLAGVPREDIRDHLSAMQGLYGNPNVDPPFYRHMMRKRQRPTCREVMERLEAKYPVLSLETLPLAVLSLKGKW